MAVTLLEAAVTEMIDPRKQVIVQMFTQESQVMKQMLWKEIPGRYYDYGRDASLPAGPYTRAVNQPWTESAGILAPYREHLKIYGGVVDIDQYISTTDPNGARSEKQIQTRLKIQAIMNDFDRSVIEGSELNSPNEIVGWRSRCVGANQLITNASGGGALTLRNVHNLLDAVKGPNSEKHLYMNPTLRLKLWDLIDAGGAGTRYKIDVTQSEFGNFMIERYAGATINAMRMDGDGSTLLGFDEDPGDGTADCASIYCVRYSEDDGVVGVYNHGGKGEAIMTQEIKAVSGTPVDRLMFELYAGQVVHQPRALGRLIGITNV
jgi:hypothetical protein